MRQTILRRVLCAATMVFSLAAHAQDFPHKPIRIIVPYDPGATTDAVARLVAQELGKKWNQPVIVENLPGASGGIGARLVARAAPDGYTLLVTPAGVLTTNKFLYSSLLYDPEAFVPVSLIVTTPLVLVNNSKSSPKSLQELIDYGKANPGKLNFASQGVGNVAHLAPELVKSMTGITMSHIPYKGSAPAVTALLAGDVDFMMCVDLNSALPHIRSGRLRALASCEAQRTHQLPDVPTMAETLPGLVAPAWFGMVAPPQTPPEIVNKISSAIAEVLKTDAVKKTMESMNVDAVGSTPKEMAATLTQERERWGKVIRDNNIKAN